MRSVRTGWLWGLSALLLVYCNKNKDRDASGGEEPDGTVFKLNKTVLNVLSTGGKDSVEVTGSVKWTLTGLPSWIAASPASGEKNGKVVFVVEANTATASRTVKLTLSGTGAGDSTVTVNQMGSTPTVLVDKLAAEEKAEGQRDSLVITANTDWQLDIPGAWITADKKTGTAGVTKVFLTVAPNTSLDERKMTLRFTGEGAEERKVDIKQLGVPATLTVDKTSLSENGEGKLELVVNSNVPWTLEVPGAAGWITADKSSGPAGSATKVTLTIALNASGGERFASLSLKSTGASVSPVAITVNQKQPLVYVNSFTAHAKGGASITINGTGFADAIGKNKVTINGALAVVTAATATALTVTVPARAGSGTVKVEVGGNSGVNGVAFVYDWVYEATNFVEDGSALTFSVPTGVAVGKDGYIYVADQGNHRVLKVSADGKTVTTLAGLKGSSGHVDDPVGANARFTWPTGIVLDKDNNVYVVESRGWVRKITPAGAVTTIAGDGTTASFNSASGIVIDKANNLYVADRYNDRIRKITPAGVITDLTASMNKPAGLAIDDQDNIYIADNGSNRILKLNPSWTLITVLAGGTQGLADGAGGSARFDNPYGIAIGANGELFIGDQHNHAIRKVDLSKTTPEVTTLAGNGLIGYENKEGKDARFNYPCGVAVDAEGSIFVADYSNNRIRKLIRK